jgi:hypothetical protein
MKVFVLVALSAVVLLGSLINSDAQMEPIGVVKSLDNTVFVPRQNEDLKAEQGMAIVLGDEIKTGPDGKIGIIFKDDAILSMGPQSGSIISEFMFEPIRGKALVYWYDHSGQHLFPIRADHSIGSWLCSFADSSGHSRAARDPCFNQGGSRIKRLVTI